MVVWPQVLFLPPSFFPVKGRGEERTWLVLLLLQVVLVQVMKERTARQLPQPESQSFHTCPSWLCPSWQSLSLVAGPTLGDFLPFIVPFLSVRLPFGCSVMCIRPPLLPPECKCHFPSPDELHLRPLECALCPSPPSDTDTFGRETETPHHTQSQSVHTETFR